MRNFIKLFFKKEQGAAATEFALLGPMLIFLLVGTLDFGLFVKQEMQLQAMVTATVDYAARIQGDSNILAIAEGAYEGDFAKVTVTSVVECECFDGVLQVCPADCADDDFERRYVNVSASGTYDTLFPYPGIPDSMSLQSTARMRID